MPLAVHSPNRIVKTCSFADGLEVLKLLEGAGLDDGWEVGDAIVAMRMDDHRDAMGRIVESF